MADPMSILGVSDSNTEEQTGSNPDHQYWASLPTDEVGQKLVDRVGDYDLYCRTFGQLWLWRRSYYAYYKNYFRGGRMLRAGDVGQFKTLSINHYRSIIQGLLTLITAQDPSFEPQAINSDSKSQAQCLAAKNILDYQVKHENLNKKLIGCAEKGLIYGEAYLFLDWDTSKGAVLAVDPTTQRPIHEGDVAVKTYSPGDVVRDYACSNSYAGEWYILRDYVNKWDLVAMFPEKTEEIIAESIAQDVQVRRLGHTLSENDEDLLAHYTFVHKKTAAMPNGRIVKFINQDTVLIDTPLPFDDFPVYRLAPSDQEETTFGFTPGFDLLAIQECLDKLISVVVTNQLTFGVQNIVAPLGTKLSPQTLLDGLNLILTDMRNGIPQVLELVKTPAEIFQFIQFLVDQMQLISGLNAVARGAAPENLKSGTALAFVQSQAIQANSGLQRSFMRMQGDVGTGYLNILKKFGKNKKLMALAGEANSGNMQQFTTDDIEGVSRVVVEDGNPLTKTTAGRIEVAQNLLQSGLIKTPEEFLSVVETGQLESLVEGSTSELIHIRQENEALRKGGPVQGFLLDNHPLHMKEHMAVINSVDIRNSNDPAVQATMQHIMQHIQLWMSMPPNAMAALGIPPPPMPMMPGQPPQAPSAPQGPGGPPPHQPKGPSGEPIAQVENPANPIQAKAGQVQGPKPPAPPHNAAPQQKAAMLEGGHP